MNRMIRRGLLTLDEDGNYEPGVVVKQEDVDQDVMVGDRVGQGVQVKQEENEERAAPELYESANWVRPRCTVL